MTKEDDFNFDEPEMIVYEPEKLAKMLDRASKEIIERNATVFQSAGRLVHPMRLDKADSEGAAIRRPAGTLLVRNIAPLRLREYITDNCNFVIRRKGSAKRIAAPIELAHHLLARADKWKFHVLNGIIETPTLRTNGTLLQREGYDKKSGIWADFNGVKFPAVSKKPTKGDALQALETIKKVIAGFPFVEANGESPSRSVALSAILTAVVRRSLHSAPMHGSSAPTPGTGKTLLWNVVGMIASCRQVAAISYGTPEENEKRLFTVLKEGSAVILIDNVERPIGGEALCTVLTEAQWKSRILGVSESAEVATNALLLATGNNLTFAGDITRRVLLAKLDARMEHPESRAFDVNLKTYIPQHRPALVNAALTIIRAHIAAGLPGRAGLDPFGSFEQWSDWIRGALVWLGEADPCLTRKFIEANDTERDVASALLRAIHDAKDAQWFQTKELCGDAIRFCSDETLWDAIQAARGNSREPEVRALGRYLKRQEGRIYNGLCLASRTDRNGVLEFQVREA